jgi:DNA modification methylase
MTILLGDCRAGMRLMPENSVDSIVTDPPYGLSKQPKIREVLKHWLNGDDYKATGSGFMGKSWDSFVPGPATWSEAYRILKPGGVAAVFAGSRTVDLMATSLRLAGFEIFDMGHWLYGSGFPKSLNVSKHIEGEEAKRWEGFGTALKPCHEPIVFARKPLDGTYANNVMTHGCGALNIDGCRIPFADESDERKAKAKNQHEKFESGARSNAVYGKDLADRKNYDPPGRWPGNVWHDGGLPEPMATYFYCAKASKADREAGLKSFNMSSAAECTERTEGSDGLNSPRAGAGRTGGGRNIHPTVKPTELMRWLVRLVTPPGGLCADPFVGSGSTPRACALEGFPFIGWEIDPDYHAIAEARSCV